MISLFILLILIFIHRVGPSKRITVKEALEHPFLQTVRQPDLEVQATTRMVFPFEYTTISHDSEKMRLRRLIYQEARQFQYE